MCILCERKIGMSQWNIVKSAEDIEKLIKEYYGFHDSCLVEASYKTGEAVIEKSYEVWLKKR